MRIANNAGFCFGVKRAIDAAESCVGGEIKTYLLGELIHNKTVVDRLSEKGLVTVSSVDELDDISDGHERGRVIIRSHGADKATYEALKAKGYEIVDATCPFVKKIHDLVRKHYEAGYHIVIIGSAEHPEVIATDGWCDNTATVIDEIGDLNEPRNRSKNG